MTETVHFESNLDRVVYLIGEYKFLLSVLALGVLTVLAVVLLNLPIPDWNDIPRWGQVAIIVTSIGWPLPLFAGSYLANKLHDPDWVYPREIDAARPVSDIEDIKNDDGTIDKQLIAEKHKIPKSMWETQLTVTEGKIYWNKIGGYPIVREIDYGDDVDGVEVVGPWMGEKTDVEVATSQEAIAANRGQLREWAQAGQQLYAKLPAISQAIESRYWKAMSDDKLDRVAKHSEVVRGSVVEDVEKLTDSLETPDNKDSDDGTSEPDRENLSEEVADEAIDGGVPEEWKGGGVDE
ncbi:MULTISPECIES: hypothetical protein [Halorussus]|uniref:hypothetical protein n=1 Tax=Halorussus TaxID=1070314 RepID=UPI00209F93C2|nr:hypothetical protein [Halorussus vallis]USZ74048.1 hypothetical protein NGM07_11335 [Halorussus vallis]